jgi:hypothetical protein
MRKRLTLTGAGAMCAAAMAIAGSASASTAAGPHYDAKAHWRMVLKTTASRRQFIAIAASGPRSAWAIGLAGRSTTYLVRWNGQAWRRMASLPAHYYAIGVSGSSPSDVYVTGQQNRPGAGTVQEVLRWNGLAWSRALITPAVAILDIGPRNVWVESQSGYIDHWDGVAWTRTPYRYGVSDRPGTIAAVGQQPWRTVIGALGQQRHRLIVQRWTGKAWQEVASPHPRVTGNLYPAISASTATNVWIQLLRPDPSGHNVRLLHWDGKTWTAFTWPWNLSSAALGYMAAVGRASVWLGNGELLRNPSGWHIPKDGNCGIPVGVPRTNTALCAGAVNGSRAGTLYGVIWQSGSLP